MKKILLIIGAIWLVLALGWAIFNPNSAKESFEQGMEEAQQVSE